MQHELENKEMHFGKKILKKDLDVDESKLRGYGVD
jgi:hypothetical protein